MVEPKHGSTFLDPPQAEEPFVVSLLDLVPSSGSPNSGLQCFYVVDYRTLRRIHFSDPPSGLGSKFLNGSRLSLRLQGLGRRTKGAATGSRRSAVWPPARQPKASSKTWADPKSRSTLGSVAYTLQVSTFRIGDSTFWILPV